MRVLTSLGSQRFYNYRGMRSYNKHSIMPKWDIFDASVFLNEQLGTPLFISKLKFSYDKYSVDKV